MADDRAVGELERFLAERADRLMRTAVLLTGSREAGQDLLQTALERLLRHWRRLDGDPEAYLRRTLYNLAADGFRRQGLLQRKLFLLRAGAPPATDPIAEVDLRDALVRMLLQLPPRQRAVLVLKYWEQLSEAETAAVLGTCGTSRRKTAGGPTWPRAPPWLAASSSAPTSLTSTTGTACRRWGRSRPARARRTRRSRWAPRSSRPLAGRRSSARRWPA